MSHYDIVIVGAGAVGAAAAVALASRTPLRIALLDSRQIAADWCVDKHDHRVSAISPLSQLFLQRINVWDTMQSKRVSPYSHMTVWDQNTSAHIEFAAQDVGTRSLGFIVEDSVMRASLFEAAEQYPQIDLLSCVNLAELRKDENKIELIDAEGKRYTANLLIAADGANSWVRQTMKMEMTTRDYEHTAIVATVKTEKPHQMTAWQRFLSTGCLAFLPLENPRMSSIVWSTLPEDAAELMSLEDAEFIERLSHAFDKQLGDVIGIEKRYSFPLHKRHIKNYVLPRIAFIGDAAHTIHPLVGQGVNLGLFDAACLVQTIEDALVKRRDYASLPVLRKYERWRKGDTVMMLAMVDAMKKAFMSDNMIVKTVRSLGFNAADKLSFVKNYFARYALGRRGELPNFLR